jgi:hypothetical protein
MAPSEQATPAPILCQRQRRPAFFGRDQVERSERGLKGPRTYEGTGMPFHLDNQTVIKERLFLDKTNQDELYDAPRDPRYGRQRGNTRYQMRKLSAMGKFTTAPE